MFQVRNRAKLRTRVLKIKTEPSIVKEILDSVNAMMAMTINIENIQTQPPVETIRAQGEPAYVILACIINHELKEGVERKGTCSNTELTSLHAELNPTQGNMRVRVEWVTDEFRQSFLVDFVPRDERSVVTRLVESQGHHAIRDHKL